MWEGDFQVTKKEREKEKSIQTVYTYPHDNKSLTTFFPIVVDHQLRKKISCLTLSYSCFFWATNFVSGL
jgi:hypothetical protein